LHWESQTTSSAVPVTLRKQVTQFKCIHYQILKKCVAEITNLKKLTMLFAIDDERCFLGSPTSFQVANFTSKSNQFKLLNVLDDVSVMPEVSGSTDSVTFDFAKKKNSQYFYGHFTY